MRASRLVLLCLVPVVALGGCGEADDPPGGAATATAAGPPLRGLQARRNRAPAVLAALERAVGADAINDLTFDRRRFTVLTSWVTQEQHDQPATELEGESEVRSAAKVALVCRTVASIDPEADAFVAGYDGTSWLEVCPQNRDGRPPR